MHKTYSFSILIIFLTLLKIKKKHQKSLLLKFKEKSFIYSEVYKILFKHNNLL